MKISKLLFLGVLIPCLFVVSSAFGQQCSITDGISTDKDFYVLGEDVVFTISMSASGCSGDVTNVSLYFFKPDNYPPSGIPCIDPTLGTLIASGLTLINGDPPIVFEGGIGAGQYPDLLWPVTGADVTTGYVRGYYAIRFTKPGQLESCDSDNIMATVYSPDISLDKWSETEVICEGDTPTVTYNYDVTNTGNEDLTSIVVTDAETGYDICTPVVPVDEDTDGFNDGDTNMDGYLNPGDPGETWLYTCSRTVSLTSGNLATVTALGRYTDEPVSDQSPWLVEAVPPPEVSVDPELVELCENGVISQVFCAVIDVPGTPPYTYEWRKTPDSAVIGTESCYTATEAGEYCVTVKDKAGCEDTACGTLTVLLNPSCILEAAEPPVCPSEGGNYVTAIVTGGTPPYATLDWDIKEGTGYGYVSGDGTLTLEYSVGVDASECATFVLYVTDDKGCITECEVEVCCAGEMACGYTQGFYGNEGGKACDGKTTREIINAALIANGGPIVVGVAGSGSIAFVTDQDVLDGLPAGGPAKELKGDYTYKTLPKNMKKKKEDRVANVAVGQAVALTINLLLVDCHPDASPLGTMVIPPGGVLCTIGEGEDCAKTYTFPESTWGLSAADVLADLNLALAGEPTVSGASLKELSAAADGFNNAYDECRTKVACPVEICDNLIDDDCDGLTDCDDPDCEGDLACEPE